LVFLYFSRGGAEARRFFRNGFNNEGHERREKIKSNEKGNILTTKDTKNTKEGKKGKESLDADFADFADFNYKNILDLIAYRSIIHPVLIMDCWLDSGAPVAPDDGLEDFQPVARRLSKLENVLNCYFLEKEFKTMCAKYDELNKFDEKVLDKADGAYEEKHGDYDKNEKLNEHQARSDYHKIAKGIEREG